jgi:Asp-tRNA(Asn)/Glu-tRNA(Gln) amidotransferase A subunit family amidase
MLALGGHLLYEHRGYHYVRAQNLRAELREQVTGVLDDVDVLAAPTTPMTALELGGFDRGTTPPINWDTHPTDLTGHPSISVPIERDGLPVGLQFIGPHFDESSVFDAARAYASLA